MKVFIACESADLLMYYQPLPSDDRMTKAMLKYRDWYVEGMKERGLEMYHVELRSQLYERSNSIVSFIKELENIKK